jgi:hypothetical protein
MQNSFPKQYDLTLSPIQISTTKRRCSRVSVVALQGVSLTRMPISGGRDPEIAIHFGARRKRRLFIE